MTDYDVAVLGVPFDNGTSYRPGARFGPMAVRQASRRLRPGYHVELGLSPFQSVQVADAGDVSVTPFDADLGVPPMRDPIKAGDLDILTQKAEANTSTPSNPRAATAADCRAMFARELG